MRIYYAHPMNLYGTAQEERDIATLEGLGFEVVNPGTPEHEAASKYEDDSVMNYYRRLVGDCDAFAFRGCPDGFLTCGVADELSTAELYGLPIIELPSSTQRRRLSMDATKEYLEQVGER